MIHEFANAKINLGLEVGAIREDGYHDMNTIMVPLELADELTFEKSDEGILLIDNTTIAPENNFVYKAARLFFDTYKIDGGVIIKLIKNIPSEAGLGGGSADAAACLRGLNRLFKLNKSLDELALLATKLGSDMPFCVYNQIAYCTGRGEIVKPLDVKYKPLSLAIIKPPFGLSTKDVYSVAKCDTVNIHKSNFEGIVEALKQGDILGLEKSIFNELEEAAFSLIPRLESLKKELNERGFVCQMSGSGTAFFAISRSNDYSYLKTSLRYYQVFFTSLK